MVVDMFPFTSAMFSPNATPENMRPIAEQMRAGIARSSGEGRRVQIDRTIASMVRTEAQRPIAVEDSMTSDPAVSGQAMYDLVTTDLRPELANIRVPITVLWVRTEGAPMNEEQMAAFYRTSFAAAPQARLVHVPESYHFIMWDQPAVFQRELRTFLSAR